MEGAHVVAIGMGLVWIGYAVGMYGYCLVRGYDVPFMQVFKATWTAPGAGEGSLGPVKPAGGAGEALIGPVKPGA